MEAHQAVKAGILSRKVLLMPLSLVIREMEIKMRSLYTCEDEILIKIKGKGTSLSRVGQREKGVEIVWKDQLSAGEHQVPS